MFYACSPGIRSKRTNLNLSTQEKNRIPPARDPSRRTIPARDPSHGTPPRRDSSQNGIPPKRGFLPKLEGDVFFPGGIPFWEESCFGRNPVLGGILFREESRYGRNPVSGGIKLWEESRFGRSSAGGIPCGRSSSGGIPAGGVSWEESRLGGVPRPPLQTANSGILVPVHLAYHRPN